MGREKPINMVFLWVYLEKSVALRNFQISSEALITIHCSSESSLRGGFSFLGVRDLTTHFGSKPQLPMRLVSWSGLCVGCERGLVKNQQRFFPQVLFMSNNNLFLMEIAFGWEQLWRWSMLSGASLQSGQRLLIA